MTLSESLLWASYLYTKLDGKEIMKLRLKFSLFTILNFVSWFCVFKYLRRFAEIRVYIKLVLASIAAMFNFLIIFAIVVHAFTSS